MALDLDRINALDRDAFVELLGGVFEHSPWVAAAAWDRQPFASIDALHAAMLDAVTSAGRERQLGLLRAHPRLAGKAMLAGTLTADSAREQQGAGLAQCTPSQLAQIEAMNRDYEARFGFPFIVAVKGMHRDEILARLEQRLHNDIDDEFRQALAQVAAITRMRLDAGVAEPPRTERGSAHLEAFLAQHGIETQRFEHPPVMTVEESERLVPKLPGVKTKNLFLRDKKGARHILATVPHDRSVDLAALGGALGTGRLGFASAGRLHKYLGITPGSVSLLALVNDVEKAVEFVIDRSLWEADAVQAHPLVNSATLAVPHAALERFLAATGHVPRVVDVPRQPGITR